MINSVFRITVLVLMLSTAAGAQMMHGSGGMNGAQQGSMQHGSMGNMTGHPGSMEEMMPMMDEMTEQLTDMADRLKGGNLTPDQQVQMGGDMDQMIEQMKSMRATMMDSRGR